MASFDIKNNSSLTDNLVSVWLSDESGLTGDLHGANTATNNGASLSTGLNGDAAIFDAASSEYINTNYAPALTDQSFSISLWAKYILNTNITMVGSIAEKGANDPIIKIATGAITSGSPYVQTRDSNNANLSVDHGTDESDGTWVHIVLVRDTSGNNEYIYVNNSASSASDTRTGNFDISSYPFFIGGSNLRGSYGEGFTGEVHQVCFWTKALSSPNVSYLFNDGNGRPYEATRRIFNIS